MRTAERVAAWRDFLAGAILSLLTLAVISAREVGDTFVYVGSVEDFHAGVRGQFNPLGEFGHLLWRPLAALLSPVFAAVIPDAWAWNMRLKTGLGLVMLNEIAAICAAALIFAIAHRLSGSRVVAAVTTIGLIWANGFLLYSTAARLQ
jgi:hypothetical protein